MKIAFIVLLFICKGALLAEFRFKAVDTRTDKEIVPDSIRVVNESLGLDTIIYQPVYKSLSVGIENENGASGIYPSILNGPAIVRSNITGMAVISIADVSGNVYFSDEIDFTGSREISLEAGGLPRGLYFLNMTGAKGSESYKFLVEESIPGNIRLSTIYGGNKNPQIQQDKMYKFTAYAKGYKEKIYEMPDSEKDVEITFAFDDFEFLKNLKKIKVSVGFKYAYYSSSGWRLGQPYNDYDTLESSGSSGQMSAGFEPFTKIGYAEKGVYSLSFETYPRSPGGKLVMIYDSSEVKYIHFECSARNEGPVTSDGISFTGENIPCNIGTDSKVFLTNDKQDNVSAYISSGSGQGGSSSYRQHRYGELSHSLTATIEFIK